MDIVFIKGLKVRARIDVLEWERRLSQILVLDLDLRTAQEAGALIERGE